MADEDKHDSFWKFCCRHCEEEISFSSDIVCPRCKKYAPFGWNPSVVIRVSLALALLVTLAGLVAWPIIRIVGFFAEPSPPSLPLTLAKKVFHCPPIQPGVLWLPVGKRHVMAYFQAKAQQLNNEGKCVTDGSFGVGYDKYYFAVSPTGSTGPGAYFVRYTEDELRSPY